MHEIPKHYDYTMLSTYLRCKRRYYYRMVRHLTGTARMQAAEFGHAIHQALDSWYKKQDDTLAIAIFKTDYLDDGTDAKRTHAVGEKLLKIYFEKYRDQRFKVLASEQVFEIQLIKDTDTMYMGRIDKIIDWDGAIYVLDHKTTSRLGYEYFYRIKPNMQFDGYIMAARALGHQSCSGVVLDALLVAKGLLSPSSLQRLTPVARDISTRTEQELREFKEDVADILREIRVSYEGNTWHRNTEGCCDFIQCPYRRVCSAEPELRESIISSDYVVEKWDPRKETPKHDKHGPQTSTHKGSLEAR